MLKKYLQFKNDKIVSQAIICIGNIASENSNYKKMIVNQDILSTVISISKNGDRPLTLITNSLFLITTLCRGELPSSSIVFIIYIDYSTSVYYYRTPLV